MGVRQGGARAMMAAYNAVNGVPAHVHPMLREIVVKEWGMDGILCTDGGGLALLVRAHKAYPDPPEAAAACIKAGINHFLDRHKPAVTEALSRGLLKDADIDQALRGLFRVSIRLGSPTRPSASRTRRSARPTTPSP
jgi:beta-glucosidase